jgi:hypothetical protein
MKGKALLYKIWKFWRVGMQVLKGTMALYVRIIDQCKDIEFKITIPKFKKKLQYLNNAIVWRLNSGNQTNILLLGRGIYTI